MDWQDISTVPRGTPVDVWLWDVDADGAVSGGFRMTDVSVMVGSAPHRLVWLDNESAIHVYRPDEEGQFVSHWMPAPVAPSPPSTGERNG